MYRTLQEDLLDHEIKSKNTLIEKYQPKIEAAENDLRRSVSRLDFSCLRCHIQRNIAKLRSETNSTHERKMNALGGRSRLQSCDPSSVIFNYSTRILSSREQFLLSFGLDFGLPVYRPSFYKFFLPFETFLSNLSRKKIMTGYNFHILCDQIKRKTKQMFYGFKANKVFSPIFDKADINLMRKLGRDDKLVICSPDKGRGVVLMDREDYNLKMDSILSDSSKFERISAFDPLCITV